MDVKLLDYGNNVAHLAGICPFCDRTCSVAVPLDGYKKWKNGHPIKDALPGFDLDTLYTIMTGVHSECWPPIGDGI